MWLKSLLPTVLLAASVRPEPGLLRVPKVYNAVITSNQNLAPSRAYPVIQPVVHRTAIGYVPPPFYYPPIPPGFGGPVLPLQPGSIGQPPARPDDVESVETTDPARQKKTSKTENDDTSAESTAESSEESTATERTGKKGKTDRAPLSFYPNYQSLYYDPYFYPYNAFPPHIAAPGSYYVDYPQPPGILGPLGPLPPPGYPIPAGQPEGPPSRPEKDSSPRSGKQVAPPAEPGEKVPDVPAPPLPTAVRKKAS